MANVIETNIAGKLILKYSENYRQADKDPGIKDSV
jgi:hypothetical protein